MLKIFFISRVLGDRYLNETADHLNKIERVKDVTNLRLFSLTNVIKFPKKEHVENCNKIALHQETVIIDYFCVSYRLCNH